MENINISCFVCKKKVDKSTSQINKELLLPVCNSCKNTDNEKKAVKEYLESLADGFVCGCI